MRRDSQFSICQPLGLLGFIHDRNIFVVRRLPSKPGILSAPVPHEYAAAPEGDEPLIVMCLGRTVQPIKRFLDHCRDFAEKQREAFITVRSTNGSRYSSDPWDTTILRSIRPLETIHFDEAVKVELIADITDYLDPETRRFYTARGIPYRRGYFLHGRPGTGKTSLSLGLASFFGLEIYLLHIPSVIDDIELSRLFTSLPPRCIVLLEDVDAVGMKRRSAKMEKEEDDEENKFPVSRVTLSGLLNVLDGVASQEGRIVLMTSNFAHRLDPALTRPGRIDRTIHLENISARTAQLMFLRMYAPDEKNISCSLSQGIRLIEGELEKLALKFSNQIPDTVITPAQLQGYLLNFRNLPTKAVAEIATWVTKEQIRIEEAKVRAQEKAALRAKMKQERAMNALLKASAGAIESLDHEPLAQTENQEISQPDIVERPNDSFCER